MAATDQQAERRLGLKRGFSEFLEQDHGVNPYADAIKALVNKGELRLDVGVHDLREFRSDLHKDLFDEPTESIPAFEDALDEYIKNSFPKQLAENQQVRLAFSGEFGERRVSPRALTAELLSKLINLEGIVTKASLVHPKVLKSVHYSEETRQFTSIEYRDVTSFTGLPTGSAYPTKDDEGHVLTTEYGLCLYRDHQVVVVQELPETAPAGQLPRSTDIILEDDLVDSCKPGDRISVVGVYRPVAPRAQGKLAGTFKAQVVGQGVQLLARQAGVGKDFTEEDVANFTALAASATSLKQLATSLAPSIFGHELVKKGLVLQLLGGRERILNNGTHLRGDINSLMVGDPGVAKSQLLRAVINVTPLAVSTTGRGSSGVGLTAAVTHDADTGERRLEAGAMVLADRGIVCIDEFDKMNDLDRVAIHEVMEQQTVTIAKAGIQSSLNARCSVVAAANPLYGSYEQALGPAKNINLPDSLLSRFDLLFILRDTIDEASDGLVAKHVVNQHRWRPAGDDGHTPISDEPDRLDELDEEEEEADLRPHGDMYEKYNACLHGPRKDGVPPPLSVNFMKKFFIYAKQRCSDLQMTAEAGEAVAAYYTTLRKAQGDKTNKKREGDDALPVTVRTLETIIRLSVAVGKARLAEAVTKDDVAVATGLLDAIKRQQEGQLSSEGEEEPEPRRQARSGRRAGAKRRTRARREEDGEEEEAADGSSGDDDDEDENNGGNNENDPGAGNVPRRRLRQRAEPMETEGPGGEQEDEEMDDQDEETPSADATPAQTDALVAKLTQILIDRPDTEGFPVEEAFEELHAAAGCSRLSNDAIVEALEVAASVNDNLPFIVGDGYIYPSTS